MKRAAAPATLALLLTLAPACGLDDSGLAGPGQAPTPARLPGPHAGAAGVDGAGQAGAGGSAGSVQAGGPGGQAGSPGAAGAGGTGGVGGAPSPCDPSSIWAAKGCAAATICHDADGSAAGLAMAGRGWQSRLVGVSGNGGGSNPSVCTSGGPYLRPYAQPADGLFMLKLVGGAGLCGMRMPEFADPLTADEMACVQSWADALVAAYVPPPFTPGP
jgi:hypothetical protein